jgi:hypothetical protein
MDASEITRILELAPSPSGDAIRQIVQVFEDGCRAAAALRRTADDLSAIEIQTKLNSIEHRMMRQIATICERFAQDAAGSPALAGQAVPVAPVTTYDTLADCLADLPVVPRN